MNNTKLETVDCDYYDGPFSEVNVIRNEDNEIRLEIKLAHWLKDPEGWCTFTPSLEEVEEWCAKARKHVTPKESG